VVKVVKVVLMTVDLILILVDLHLKFLLVVDALLLLQLVHDLVVLVMQFVHLVL